MATVSNLTQYFTQGAIEGFSDLVAPLTAFSFKAEQEGAVLNDVVRVPFIAANTSSYAFTYAGGYANNNGQVVGKSVTLNNLLYQKYDLTDAEMQQLSPDAITRQGNVLGRRLAADFISASFANVVSNVNYPTSSSYTSGQFTSSVAIADLDKRANDAKWVDGERYLIAGTGLWQNLMNNTNFTNAYAFGGAEAVKEGRLPNIFGFQPFKTTVTLPASDTGFACNSNAMAIVMAYHRPAAEASNIVESVKMVDEKTGIVLGYRSWYDPTYATTKRVIEVLGGSALVDPNALIHIK
jgi:hypothetical protein